MESSDNEAAYVFQTMLTCIGNKRKLVGHIRDIVDDVRRLLSREKLNIVDGFAGSVVVSRKLSYVSDNLYCNDMEMYSYVMAICSLVTPSTEQERRIRIHIDVMNGLAERGPFVEGIICRLYAPKDTYHIKDGERCFYTRENALIIDTLRNYIHEKVESDIVPYCLAPLLNRASIHTNTAGVFKGFYKKNGIGRFGGTGENALSRIMKPIRIDVPVWNRKTGFKAICTNKDFNTLVRELPADIDIIYMDPPYNQHPYGSNYFMLNVIAKNQEPVDISKVSGIPSNWNKSSFNSHDSAVSSMRKLIEDGLSKSKYLLISYNNEGIIQPRDWELLFALCHVKEYKIRYDTFKGCRNIRDRSDKVMEIMYLVSKRL